MTMTNFYVFRPFWRKCFSFLFYSTLNEAVNAIATSEWSFHSNSVFKI